MAVVTMDGRILDCNDALARILRYERTELRGRSVADVTHPGDMARDLALKQDLLAEGRTSGVMEKRYVTKDGQVIWGRLTVSFAMGADGRPAFVIGMLEDVTSRVLAEEALRATLERQEMTLSSIDEIVYAVGAPREGLYGGPVLFVSDRVRDILGYTPEEFRSDPELWLSLVHPDDAAGLAEQTAEIHAAGRAGTRTYRLLARNGDYRWIEDRVVPHVEPDGRLSGTFGVVRDVTERKAALDALTESERRFRDLFDQSQGIITTMDMGLRVTAINPEAERLLGYRPVEVIGRTLLEFVPEDGVASVASHLETLREQGASEGTVLLRDRAGQVHTLAFRAAITGRKDGPSGILANAVDITAIVRAEAALRRSEAAYRELVEKAAAGIFVSGPEPRFLDVNPALVAMLGYDSAEEVLALDLLRDVYVDPAERARLLRDLRAHDGMHHAEVAWRRRDGSHIRVQLDLRLMGEERHQGIARDITQQRQLEEQLRQSQKMEALGQLTGGIAHDFNNLLTAILANIEFVIDAPALPPDVVADLQEVRGSALSGAEVVRKLMTFSRREQLRPERVDLARVCEDLGQMLRRVLPETVKVVTDRCEAGAAAMVDRSALQQIVLNLAANARDAMPAGGTLTLTARLVMLSAAFCRSHPWARPGPWCRMDVADTGTGISEAVLPRLFQPFVTTKPRGQGTGLGLSSVYGLVQQHGGAIEVDTARDRGTTFHIYLPYTEVEDQDAESDMAQLRTGSETILVVEDNEVIRRGTARVLERLGYRVRTAADGAEALELMAQTSPGEVALVVTDVVMPRMGGFELADALRGTAGCPRFLFLSGYPGDPHGSRATEANRLLLKPWTITDLANAVRAALDAR